MVQTSPTLTVDQLNAADSGTQVEDANGVIWRKRRDRLWVDVGGNEYPKTSGELLDGGYVYLDSGEEPDGDCDVDATVEEVPAECGNCGGGMSTDVYPDADESYCTTCGWAPGT